MSLLWLAPVVLTLVACALLWRWQQAIEAEHRELRRELQTLPVLAARIRAVRRQTERTGAATDSAADVFGSHLRK
jgi:hypothetical protein